MLDLLPISCFHPSLRVSPISKLFVPLSSWKPNCRQKDPDGAPLVDSEKSPNQEIISAPLGVAIPAASRGTQIFCQTSITINSVLFMI